MDQASPHSCWGPECSYAMLTRRDVIGVMSDVCNGIDELSKYELSDVLQNTAKYCSAMRRGVEKPMSTNDREALDSVAYHPVMGHIEQSKKCLLRGCCTYCTALPLKYSIHSSTHRYRYRLRYKCFHHHL